MKVSTTKKIFLIEIPTSCRYSELTIDYKLYADGKQVEVGQNYPVWMPPKMDAETYKEQFPDSDEFPESRGWNRLIDCLEGVYDRGV